MALQLHRHKPTKPELWRRIDVLAKSIHEEVLAQHGAELVKNPQALFLVATFYRLGAGGARDAVLADVYDRLSASLGYTKAEAFIGKERLPLTPKQAAESDHIVDAAKAGKPIPVTSETGQADQ